MDSQPIRRSNPKPFVVAALYFLASCIWIAVSISLAKYLSVGPNVLRYLGILMGFLYVLVSTGTVFVLAHGLHQERQTLENTVAVRTAALKQSEAQYRQLERQFLQAQKMEAVGRLAAGIAHDFNNMLGVILGYCEVARGHIEPAHPAQEHLLEIRTAGERSIALTRQLLSFSRQQVLEPRNLSLNSVVHHASRMLLRMIGEDISLVFRPTEPLGSAYADLGQIEQVLMNLAVNARDAMPRGGKIVIETANVDLDENSGQGDQPVKPGRYVTLSVSDTGTGMDEATMAKAFEPFFTTKEAGKGTGLGLSTARGIVKQCGGYIWASSEPGRGTTFKIYLPYVDQAPEILIPGPRILRFPAARKLFWWWRTRLPSAT